jgi:CheY-like chemotaxis protein
MAETVSVGTERGMDHWVDSFKGQGFYPKEPRQKEFASAYPQASGHYLRINFTSRLAPAINIHNTKHCEVFQMSRVLIVDDSWVALHHLTKYLSLDGHEIQTADCGEAALESLAASRFDVMILDLLMPGIDGFEVLSRLEDLPEAPPVIVLSADIQETTRALVLQKGAQLFLGKPPVPEQVRSAVLKLTKERHSGNQ